MKLSEICMIIVLVFIVITCTFSLINNADHTRYRTDERYISAPAEKATSQMNALCSQGFTVDSNGIDYDNRSDDGGSTYHLWESARLTKDIPLTPQPK